MLSTTGFPIEDMSVRSRRCSDWNPFGKTEKRKNAASSNVFECSAKLPKLPLVNPNTLSWRHLTKTKLAVIGK